MAYRTLNPFTEERIKDYPEHTAEQVEAALAAADALFRSDWSRGDIAPRLKILGRMDVAEKRRPLDGRIKTKMPNGQEVELRLSTLPTAFGEKLVMRILGSLSTNAALNLDKLDFSPEVLRPFKTTLKQLGITVRWVENPDDPESWRAEIVSRSTTLP